MVVIFTKTTNDKL